MWTACEFLRSQMVQALHTHSLYFCTLGTSKFTRAVHLPSLASVDS